MAPEGNAPAGDPPAPQGDPAPNTDPTPGDPAGGQPQPPASSGEPFHESKAKALIDKLRENEKTLTKERDAQAKRLREIDDANKSELERAQERANELEAEKRALETRVQEQASRTAVEREAAKAGARRPDQIYKLADLGALEFEEDGTPKNAADVVAAVRADSPELFGGAPPVDQGPRTPAGGEPSMNDRLRQAAGRGP